MRMKQTNEGPGPAAYEQLQEFEQKIFGSTENSNIALTLPNFSSSNQTPFSFGFSRANDTPIPAPAFTNTTSSSVFAHSPFEIPHEFAFGAGQPQTSTQNDSPFSASANPPPANDITMGGS